jgi:hypothetical protein
MQLTPPEGRYSLTLEDARGTFFVLLSWADWDISVRV